MPAGVHAGNGRRSGGGRVRDPDQRRHALPGKGRRTAGRRRHPLVMAASASAAPRISAPRSPRKGTKPAEVVVRRGEEEHTKRVEAAEDICLRGRFRLGVLIRDSISGIGTVTYIEKGLPPLRLARACGGGRERKTSGRRPRRDLPLRHRRRRARRMRQGGRVERAHLPRRGGSPPPIKTAKRASTGIFPPIMTVPLSPWCRWAATPIPAGRASGRRSTAARPANTRSASSRRTMTTAGTRTLSSK